MHPVECLQDQAGATGLRDRLGRRDRPRALALQDGADRVVAAAARTGASTSAPGTTRSTRSTPTPAARSGASRPTTRSTPRPPTGAGASSSRRTAARSTRSARAPGRLLLERAVAVEVRLARVLLRHADDRLRARLHRQHRRHDVRVRREEREAALGAPAGHLHLRRRGGLTSGACSWAPTTASSTRWTRPPATRSGRSSAHGAVHAAPTVMDGLVYYAICSSCGSAAAASGERGPGRRPTR